MKKKKQQQQQQQQQRPPDATAQQLEEKKEKDGGIKEGGMNEEKDEGGVVEAKEVAAARSDAAGVRSRRLRLLLRDKTGRLLIDAGAQLASTYQGGVYVFRTTNKDGCPSPIVLLKARNE